MKRFIYISAFSFFGALLALLLHAIVEIKIITILERAGEFAGLTIATWFTIHAIATPLLEFIGIVLGFFAGRHFWVILYDRNSVVRPEYRRTHSDSFFRNLQVLLLIGGTLFAWIALIGNFRNFYGIYETIFRFEDCVIPNPFVTPCFMGATAFLVALVWAYIIRRGDKTKSQRWLRNFLAFGTVFAFSVFLYEASQYYRWFAGPDIGCIPGASPWKTPCLYGGIIFLAAFLVARVLVLRQKRTF